jgi:hypothetical protein
MKRDTRKGKGLVKIPRRKKPVGAMAMLGFSARFRGEKGRRTTKVMAEL